jgi:prevent-host-death family protein
VTELKTVTAREANHRFAELLSEVERGGRGFVVTKRGRPVARIVPVEAEPRRLTPEQEAALARILTTGWDLGIGKFDRDELYDRI